MWQIHPHIKYGIVYNKPGISPWQRMDTVLMGVFWCDDREIPVEFHEDYSVLTFTNEKDMMLFMLGYAE